MRSAVLTAAALVFVGACVPVPDPAPGPLPPEPGPDACGASAMQSLVGQPSSVVMAMTFAAPMRLIRPGQPVTADYSAERLNIEVGAKDRIVRVFCG